MTPFWILVLAVSEDPVVEDASEVAVEVDKFLIEMVPGENVIRRYSRAWDELRKVQLMARPLREKGGGGRSGH